MTGHEVTSILWVKRTQSGWDNQEKNEMHQTVEITRCLRFEVILAPNPNPTETGLKVRKLSRT